MGGASPALATLAHEDQLFTTFQNPMRWEYCRAVALRWLEGVGRASPALATLAHGDWALHNLPEPNEVGVL